MRKIVGAVFQSLDGVMQAPGAPEEDRSGGFSMGGWLTDFFDDSIGQQVGQLFAEPFDLLLGRRTYDIFAAHWPFVDGEDAAMGEVFTRVGKYVVTRGQQPLPWENSHRVGSVEALAELKKGEGPNLVIQGSSTLYPQLMEAGLLDRLILMTFPVVLGTGKRILGEGTPAGAMRLVEHTVSAKGNIVACYEPAGALRPGSFANHEPSEAELARRAAVQQGTW